MKTARVIISGFVQGVGFRHFVRKEAKKLGLKGWVRNNQNGSVEALFQGEKDVIEQIIILCRKGSMIAEVKDVGVEWVEDEEEKFLEFEIV